MTITFRKVKSKFLRKRNLSSSRCAYADTFGVALYWCKMLIVISVCCESSRSHSEGGKSSMVLASTLKKCTLKFQITTSVALHLWHPGGTSSISIWHLLQMIIFIASDTSLSRMCFLGIMPARFSRCINVWYVRVSSWSLQLLSGSIRMTLLSIPTITMMYLLPCWERVGN